MSLLNPNETSNFIRNILIHFIAHGPSTITSVSNYCQQNSLLDSDALPGFHGDDLNETRIDLTNPLAAASKRILAKV